MDRRRNMLIGIVVGIVIVGASAYATGLSKKLLTPFFGSSAESEIAVADIRSGFRFPIALLVAASILFGFFPQIAVQRIAPAFRNYFTASQ